MRIALLHPGEMGAAAGASLVAARNEVGWASEGRSRATRDRAEAAGLHDHGTLVALLGGSEVVLSICPPHAAREVAREVAGAGFAGIYVDANAVAPSTARAVAETVAAAGSTYVDGGVVGGPPSGDSGPRLYLSGAEADAVAALFEETAVDAVVLAADPFAASQLKMVYAAWSKGSAALLLTAMAAARRTGLADALADEWDRSQPGLAAMLRQAEGDEAAKGWRWAGEMEEVARSMADLGLPDGFHHAAARVFAAEAQPGSSDRSGSV